LDAELINTQSPAYAHQFAGLQGIKNPSNGPQIRFKLPACSGGEMHTCCFKAVW
jgi:hypothetical protein